MIALLAGAFAFGLRHGIDWDHIAAISDYAGWGAERRHALRLASCYVAGHAMVILLLGSVAVVAGDVLPAAVDGVMGRLVGVTLLVLGVSVVAGLARRGRNFRLRSRWSVVGSIVHRIARRGEQPVVIEHEHVHGPGHGHSHHSTVGGAVRTWHAHPHVHVGELPPDPSARRLGALGVGVLHGIGAETPTQVVLFVTAAAVASTAVAELALIVFLAGLLVSNTAIAMAASSGFLEAERHFGVYAALAAVTAVLSLAVGVVFTLGLDVLPPILGG